MAKKKAGRRFTEHDVYLFREGTHRRLWERLGAHPGKKGGKKGVDFSVWAPAAKSVSVVGDFNGWDPAANPLQTSGDGGVHGGFVPGVGTGTLYKFHLVSKLGGLTVDKADPLARAAELPPRTASVVSRDAYEWGDADWLAGRPDAKLATSPMSTYEVHLGSWKRPGGEPLSYLELADELVPYVKKMGFTHVEFLPPMEHPFYGSWGYQATGYFAPTSRYGAPRDMKALIDAMHRAGIGVVLDWVPSHFPGDEHGLFMFDGTHLFEHADPKLGFHPDWKSHIFNYGRGEVRSFLISSALFWIEEFHIDAIRVDAVASMLYRDYSRKDGEWIPNEFGGRENIEAIQFLRALNDAVHEEHPGVAMIAEESTAWPMVSRPTYVGGLGFDMKWDLGWMHDTLSYMKHDPIHRRFHHDELTFRMAYAWTERFVLPLSHDEVVHGKGSLVAKMAGDDWQKFANLRTLYGYMYGLPGKKLLFMGSELGSWNEWNHDAELEWGLTEHTFHAGLQAWVARLNEVYRDHPAMHTDFDARGFRWIDCHDTEQSVISFQRIGEDADVLIFVCNFTPVVRADYRLGVPEAGTWAELANSDAGEFGGSGTVNRQPLPTSAMRYHEMDQSVCLTLPPLGMVVLRLDSKAEPLPPVEESTADDAES
jgi:1,4-alpha-glucan branching enzyme